LALKADQPRAVLRRPVIGREPVNDPDLAHDVAVELVDAFGRYPVLEDRPAADLLNLERSR
jgi:hypothetical protein